MYVHHGTIVAGKLSWKLCQQFSGSFLIFDVFSHLFFRITSQSNTTSKYYARYYVVLITSKKNPATPSPPPSRSAPPRLKMRPWPSPHCFHERLEKLFHPGKTWLTSFYPTNPTSQSQGGNPPGEPGTTCPCPHFSLHPPLCISEPRLPRHCTDRLVGVARRTCPSSYFYFLLELCTFFPGLLYLKCTSSQGKNNTIPHPTLIQ